MGYYKTKDDLGLFGMLLFLLLLMLFCYFTGIGSLHRHCVKDCDRPVGPELSNPFNMLY